MHFANYIPTGGMPYGPAVAAVVELPYSAMIASFVLVLVWAAAADRVEPNISEPTGAAAVCDAAAGMVVAPLISRSVKGSASAWCDGGETSDKHSHKHPSKL